eukprot:1051916-Alexandrium_andersonii.AAC.1
MPRAPASPRALVRSQHPRDGRGRDIPGGPSAEGSRLSSDSGAPCPAQGPPARGHCGPGRVQHPQTGASPQGLAQGGQ